jgi:ankyrin repeat protein
MGIMKEYPIMAFVDALDECNEGLEQLLSFFKDILTRLPRFRICLSSRPYRGFSISTSPEIGIFEEIILEDENDSDIRIYVREKLESKMKELKQFGDEEQREEDARVLTNEIVSRASGVFQWVNLVVQKAVDLYSEGNSRRYIQTILKRVPDGLNGVYSQILNEAKKSNDAPRILKLVRWIYLAREPLSLTEFRFTMAFDADRRFSSILGLTDSDDYVDSDGRMQELVKKLSGGLAEVSHGISKAAVQFIHQSVNDFIAEGGLSSLTSRGSNGKGDYQSPVSGYSRGRGHDQFSKFCCQYIATADVMSCDLRNGKNLETHFPFIKYACSSLFFHAQEAEKEHCLQPQSLLEDLQWPSQRVLQRWIGLFDVVNAECPVYLGNNMSLFQIASLFCLSSVVKLLLDKGVDINSKDGSKCTALYLAAAMGDEEMMKMLLAHGADTEAAYFSRDSTALQLAASRGDEVIVRLLLAKGADVTHRDISGRVALHHAAEQGHEKIMKLLLDKKNNIGDRDRYGNTAVHLAVEEGREKALQLLFARDADIMATKDNGETAIHIAAKKGQEHVLRWLLRQRLDSTIEDSEGQTALHSSMNGGRENAVKVMEILLQNGADVNHTDHKGRTALHRAVEKDAVAVVRMLLESGADITLRDNDGQTALQRAGIYGHKAVLKIIEEMRGIADPKSSATAQLYDAVENNDEVLVQQLLDAGADVTASNSQGMTALYIAARRGCNSIVRHLLDSGADATARTKDLGYDLGNTAIHVAASHHHMTTLELLLDNCADIEAKNMFGKTVLHKAAGEGHVEVVSKLLEKGICIDTKARDGETALYDAVFHGQRTMVEFLLSEGADANTNSDDHAALDLAAMEGLDDIVRLLLDAGADPTFKTQQMTTALHQASRTGRINIVQMLIDNAADPRVQDSRGHTPLHQTLWASHNAIANLLVENGANPVTKNDDGETPLHIAARRGNDEILSSLFGKGAGDKLGDFDLEELWSWRVPADI